MVDLSTWRRLAGEMATLPLLFNAPLSERHAARLVDDLSLHEKRHILDLGCGWGGLLLRALATRPAAIGVGVDHDLAVVRRARVAAAERNLLNAGGHLRRRARLSRLPQVALALGARVLGRTLRRRRSGVCDRAGGVLDPVLRYPTSRMVLVG
ncbi:MAG: methyltransferase [Pseudonocardiales bacterium]|nr:methyltransferase [Pseudonocardiales bacterium]